jgi:hypothetical protein
MRWFGTTESLQRCIGVTASMLGYGGRKFGTPASSQRCIGVTAGT